MTFEPLSEHLSVFVQHILAGCKETPSLSSHSAVILERIESRSLNKSSFLDSSSIDFEEKPASVSSLESKADLNSKISSLSSTPPLKNQPKDVSNTLKLLRCCYCCKRTFLGVFLLLFQVSGSLPKLSVQPALNDETRGESPEADVSEVPAPPSPPAISMLSPRAMETAGHIIRFQKEQQEKAKVRLTEPFFRSDSWFFFLLLDRTRSWRFTCFFSFPKCIPWVSIVQSESKAAILFKNCVSQLLFIWTVNSAQVEYYGQTWFLSF